MSPGETAAAALSSRSECIIAAGHLSGNSQDTRHKLALSSVFFSVFFFFC